MSKISIVLCIALVGACASNTPGEGESNSTESTQLAYVSNEDSGTISVVNIDTLNVIETIPVGRRPRGIHADADGRFVFVALSGSPKCPPSMSDADCESQNTDKSQDGIAMIDALTRKVVNVFPGGSDPEQFDISPDGRFLYVANEDAGLASVVDIKAGRVVRETPVGGEPEGVRVSPNGSQVLITSESEHSVSVLDTKTFRLIRKLDVGLRPRDLIFSNDERLLFVSCEFNHRVDVFDTGDYSLVGHIQMGSSDLPMGLAITSDDRFLYVANGRGKTLAKIDVEQLSVQSSVVVGARPWGIAISADDKFIFSANGSSDDVSVVDANSMELITRIPVGETPWGVIIAPNPRL